MKWTLIVFLFTLLFARETISLKTTKKDFYVDKNYSIPIIYNAYDNIPVVLVDVTNLKVSSPLYTAEPNKSFWLSSEILIATLSKYKFSNGEYKYIYFLVKNDKDSINEKFFFKIKLAMLNRYDNRDFDKHDIRLLDSDDLQKYKLLPIRDLLKTFEIMKVFNNKPRISRKMTKAYKEFVDEVSFESNRYAEYKIEANKEVLSNLKQNIHVYCINGDYRKVKLYVKLGFNLNIQDKENQQTCLQYAALNGHYKMVKYLVKNGADVNKHKSGFENAYLAAKRLKHKKIAQYLKPLTKRKSRYVKSQSTHASGNYGLPKNQCYRVNSSYALYHYCNTGSCDGFVSNYALHQLCTNNSARGFYGSDRKTNISLYLRNGGYLGYNYFSNKAAYQSGKFNGSFQDRKNFILYLESGVTLMKY